jgi:hypothetical protein
MQAKATWAEKLRIVLSNLVASALNCLSFANQFYTFALKIPNTAWFSGGVRVAVGSAGGPFGRLRHGLDGFIAYAHILCA